MTHIVFLFPGPGDAPCGGLKVICEYANRLAQDGFRVSIVYAGSIFWSRKSPYFKATNIVRYLLKRWNGFSCRKWFPLDQRVTERFAFSLSYRHVPKADRYIATSPYTAMYLRDYPVDDANKYYFIQDYENWGDVTDEILRGTYHYPLRKIVISGWLGRIMEEEQQPYTVIPNGFDFNYFRMSVPIDRKDRFRVTMLYHKMARKGCKYGFEALNIVKKRYPQLRVNLFGIPERPAELPEWYDYYQAPDRETHNRIYNESAIYLGCSNIEGWGLTVGEAMICGCAAVCTDNPGYLEMAEDGQTALISPVRNAAGLADNIMRLLQDDALRRQIAEQGHLNIRKFTWERSCRKFRKAIGLDN